MAFISKWFKILAFMLSQNVKRLSEKSILYEDVSWECTLGCSGVLYFLKGFKIFSFALSISIFSAVLPISV